MINSIITWFRYNFNMIDDNGCGGTVTGDMMFVAGIIIILVGIMMIATSEIERE
jgi:hypothetical protein